MKLLFLLSLVFAVAFGNQESQLTSFLRTHETSQGDDSSQDLTTETDSADSTSADATADDEATTEDAEEDTVLCSSESGDCKKSQIKNGSCDVECSNSTCDFIDYEDCSAIYAN